MTAVNRRLFLGVTAGGALAEAAQNAPIPIIDTHIHLYDPTRPQGVPWPPKDGKVPYRRTLPEDYRRLVKPHGIVGAIEVECSPWLEDNQWVLDVSEKDTIMVGMVGDLEPGKPDFLKHLARFAKNPLYRGIRYGYLWGRKLSDELPKPEFIDGLKEMADAGLGLDTVGPHQLAGEILRIKDKVPNLRIVIDHLPNLEPPKDPAARAKWEGELRELGKRPQVYAKVSEVLREKGGRVAYDLNSYRSTIDMMWDVFGPDRLIYGSDWPNSEQVGNYAQVIGVVKEYFTAKGRDVAEKFFWKNSIGAYKWVKRDSSQPG